MSAEGLQAGETRKVWKRNQGSPAAQPLPWGCSGALAIAAGDSWACGWLLPQSVRTLALCLDS